MTHFFSPRQAIAVNKVFLKARPHQDRVEPFRIALLNLLAQVNESQTEEFHKNLVIKFLEQTFKGEEDKGTPYFINTKNYEKGEGDLVIHTKKMADSAVGVILEFKKPKDHNVEMPTLNQLNVKALQQLLFYFLQERLTHKNLEVKKLVITNIYEWFIFDAQDFEQFFVKSLERSFLDFTAGRLTGKTTEYFYQNIAKPAIAKVENDLKFVHFDLRNYQEVLENLTDDQALVDLFKILSPEYLLKLPSANDSNRLDEKFYGELLHIMGLTVVKSKSKKLIERKAEKDRNRGSLLENIISRLQNLDKLSRLSEPLKYGETEDEQLFAVALALVIVWINRILFLKLLEAQLVSYHKQDKASFMFLNIEKIKNYDDLNQLFFEVLAVPVDKRDRSLQREFENVPYLNSSLFEPTDLEQETGIMISNLRDENLTLFSGSVLTEKGEMKALAYLFAFLNAYDFGSGEEGVIKKDQRRLINSSVLGLIFERINGYKDGSYFTPAFITMYMCRETIRRAIVQKFNEVKGWHCENLTDLYNKIEDKKEANTIINSLKICDPAVGSGHFLVSALNEMIVIKSELQILMDREGRLLRDYAIEVANDELSITYGDGDGDGDLTVFFEYNPKSKESQRVQETLFHEKQTIIENCLFGVDINENSVQICRLRLWIELLKNAYYKADNQLETLPNIDINIKTGNSLISRFPIDSDLKSVLFAQKNQSDIVNYKSAVRQYFEARTKQDKKKAQDEIKNIKKRMKDSLQEISPKQFTLQRLESELSKLEGLQLPPSLDIQLEPLDAKAKKLEKEREKKIAKLINEIDKLKVEIEEVKSGRLYENAMEWRFEFPEVLNDQGNFVGFDIIIGNPPYISIQDLKKSNDLVCNYYSENYKTAGKGNFDIYLPFVERALSLLNSKGLADFIMPSLWIYNEYGKPLRKLILESNCLFRFTDFGSTQVFLDATIYTACQQFSKQPHISFNYLKTDAQNFTFLEYSQIKFFSLNENSWSLGKEDLLKIKTKLELNSKLLGEIAQIFVGIQTSADNVYHLKKISQGLYYSKILGTEVEIEDAIMQPLISGTEAKRYKIPKTDKYLLHPYKVTDDFSLIPINILENLYPKAFNYLKMNESFLRSRENNKMNNDLWYGYNYPKNLDKQTLSKIGIAQTVSDLQCFLDESGQFFFNNVRVNGIKPINENQVNIKYLLGVLNSKVADFYFKLVGKPKDNGFFEANKQFISPIPIKITSQDSQAQIGSLVDQILSAKKANPNADTTALEKEIDLLVYELYGLTNEEIAIIENAQ